MHNRIKDVRVREGLSQKAFGESLGVSRDVLANIENNRVEPKETFLKLMCSTYGVNEEWLRTGEGEMFRPMTSNDEFLKLCAEVQASDDWFIKKLLRVYWRMDKEKQELLRQILTLVTSGTEYSLGEDEPEKEAMQDKDEAGGEGGRE